MLKRRGCCCALQRPASIQCNTLWISDDILRAAFGRFRAVSRAAKRHGSFLPGVMHARSRLGRRRMAHMLQPEPSSPQSTLGILLGLWEDLRGITRQWDYDVTPRPWQPPRTRVQHSLPIPGANEVTEPDGAAEIVKVPPSHGEPLVTTKPDASEGQEAGVALPAQQTDLLTPTQLDEVTSVSISTKNHYVRLFTEQTMFGKTIPRFREAIKCATASDAKILCARLTRTIYTSLASGSVKPKALVPALEIITKALKTASLLDTAQQNAHCRALYLAVWTGIAACKAARPLEVSCKTLKQFLSLICRIPMVSELQQHMARDVVKSMGSLDFDSFREIQILVAHWSASWYEHISVEASETSLSSFERGITESERAVLQAHAHVMDIEEGSACETSSDAAYDAIDTARSFLVKDMGDLLDMEYLAYPLRKSAETLAEVLSLLDPHAAWQVLKGGIENSISKKIGGKDEGNTLWNQGRDCWLLTAAATKGIGDTAFLKLWKYFKRSQPLIESRDLQHHVFQDHYSSCNLLLEQWISQDTLRNPADLKLHFFSSVHERSPPEDMYLALIAAVKSQKGDVPLHVYRLLDNVVKLKMYRTTKSLWRPTEQLLLAAAELDTIHVYHMINRLSSWSTLHALKLFYHHRRAGPDHSISLATLTPFFKMLVHDPTIRTHQIWGCLRSPRIKQESDLSWPVEDDEINYYHRSQLIGNMAMEFATCTQRVKGVIFKNLMMCIAYLRYHGIRPTPAVTRAINKHVIRCGIQTGQWMQTERLRWVIDMIAEGEGERVADEVREIVTAWRGHLTRMSIEEKEDIARRQNVLRVQPGF